jgi:hypothetical protein
MGISRSNQRSSYGLQTHLTMPRGAMVFVILQSRTRATAVPRRSMLDGRGTCVALLQGYFPFHTPYPEHSPPYRGTATTHKTTFSLNLYIHEFFTSFSYCYCGCLQWLPHLSSTVLRLLVDKFLYQSAYTIHPRRKEFGEEVREETTSGLPSACEHCSYSRNELASEALCGGAYSAACGATKTKISQETFNSLCLESHCRLTRLMKTTRRLLGVYSVSAPTTPLQPNLSSLALRAISKTYSTSLS